jgi:hypothetical protein
MPPSSLRCEAHHCPSPGRMHPCSDPLLALRRTNAQRFLHCPLLTRRVPGSVFSHAGPPRLQLEPTRRMHVCIVVPLRSVQHSLCNAMVICFPHEPQRVRRSHIFYRGSVRRRLAYLTIPFRLFVFHSLVTYGEGIGKSPARTVAIVTGPFSRVVLRTENASGAQTSQRIEYASSSRGPRTHSQYTVILLSKRLSSALTVGCRRLSSGAPNHVTIHHAH